MRRTKCYRLSVLTSVYGRYGDAAFKIMRGIVNVLQILGIVLHRILRWFLRHLNPSPDEK